MLATAKIAKSEIKKLRNAIEDAKGCEVLAYGIIADEIVTSINIAARGDEESVVAVSGHMEKGDVVIHNHPNGVLKPSKADMQVASQLGTHGIGFYIVNNEVTKVNPVVEPFVTKPVKKLESETLAKLLEPNGNLESAMQDGGYYEHRPSQVAMLKRIAESYNENCVCIAEAGTGVGKSMAYLLPSLNWAESNKERVVVSTATINLQHQLIDKDIPLAKKILGSNCKTVLVKGRGNYVCIRRLTASFQQPDLFDADSDNLKVIKKWTKTTDTGTRDDLTSMIDNNLWNMVNSESDSCLGLKCPHRDDCFVIKSKKEAASARLLVVNHHLLFSDLAVRLGGAGYDSSVVLPPFTRIVFDEAHNIEQSATSFFSEELNIFALLKQINRLFASRGKKQFGAIINLQIEAGSVEEDEKIPGLVNDIKEQMQILDQLAIVALGSEMNLRLRNETKEIFIDNLFPQMIELQKRILDFLNTVEAMIKRLDEEDLELPIVHEVQMLERRLEEYASICQSFTLWEEKPDKIFWIERSKSSSGKFFARFVITPLDISNMMRESVFSPYNTVVCTSATLSVNRNFRFWSTRIGLNGYEDRNVFSSMFMSPFPYRENVLLAVPQDSPEPNNAEYQDWTADFALNLIKISQGRALLLFTSYSMLSNVFDSLKMELEELNITALKQGEDTRIRLLEKFKTDTASVLFATSSFWEGIDTPGDALKLVIIFKLPFMVPTDPVIAARMEAVEKRGGNQFMEYMLPEAVIKLKQGFGRLMRRGTDSGIVAILDSRIVTKRYGSIFIKSLPETSLSIKTANEILTDCQNFL